jgi:hypothetical protein
VFFIIFTVSHCHAFIYLGYYTCFTDFGQAEIQFEQILALDPYRIDDIDVFSNILYVTDNRLKLSRLAHEFLTLDKDRPEVCCLVGMLPDSLCFGHMEICDHSGLRKPLLAPG